MYKGESVQRQSQPKVRFKDHKLVDFEPEENDDELMESKCSESITSITRSEEESDEGSIDDETEETASTVFHETIEIEDVCEEIDQDVVIPKTEEEPEENEDYTKDFHEEVDEGSNEKVEPQLEPNEPTPKVQKAPKEKTFRIKPSKVTPSDDEIMSDDQKLRNKSCCSYKGTDEYKQKLPKYNGFNSHYGLSKEDIAKREQQQMQQQQMLQQHRLKQTEEKVFFPLSINWFALSVLNYRIFFLFSHAGMSGKN